MAQPGHAAYNDSIDTLDGRKCRLASSVTGPRGEHMHIVPAPNQRLGDVMQESPGWSNIWDVELVDEEESQPLSG
jgi:hypothetical protein